MRSQIVCPCDDSISSVSFVSSHFGLARLAAQVLLGVAELSDLAVRQLERLEEHVLGHLVGAGLDHRQAVLRADDDQVERRLRPVLLQRRVDDELAVEPADPHCARPGRRTAAARSSAPPRRR